MRLRLVLAVIALALLAWLLVHAGRPDGTTLAKPVPPDSLSEPPQLGEAELGRAEKPAWPSRAQADAPRFEPLPEDPKEIVVHLRDPAGARVLGAEVFVREQDTWNGSPAGYDAHRPWLDVEAELRSGGRKIESDAQGDLHLSIPQAWLAVVARKDELFGELTVGFQDAPEAELRMGPSRPCVVRIRDSSGGPVAGESLILAAQNGSPFWRASTDSAGLARVPNLGWLVEGNYRDMQTWFAMAEDACAVAAIRWFARAEPAPSAIELVVGEGKRVRLRVVASDGTRVPIDGQISVSPRLSSGSTSVLRIARRTNPEVPLAHGEALVARVEPGGWLDLEVGLAGSVSFESQLRVPARGEPAGEPSLRLPGELQVLVLHPTDEQGTPLASQDFEWITWGQMAGDELEFAPYFDRVHSDEQGVLALAVLRRDLHPEHIDDPDFKPPVLVHYGILRVRGTHELESAPIPFAGFGTGAVHEHGALALARAKPLVHGRVFDDRGLPLAHVLVGAEQLRMQDGDPRLEGLAGVEAKWGTQTGVDGAFVLYGSCSGGRLQVILTREGHLTPRGSEPGRLECGSSAPLELVLVRCAELRTSVRAPARLDRRLVWRFDDGSPETRMEEIVPAPGGGLLEQNFSGLLPGSYRVSLAAIDTDTPPLLVVENVLLRPGERTLDPRLMEIDLTRFALAGAPPAPETTAAPIVIQILDSNGKSLPDGRVVDQFGDFFTAQEWHGGRVRIVPNEKRDSLTVWSPGHRAWIGNCPETSGELRLEPAPMLRLQVRIPAEMRRPGWHFRVEPQVVSTDQRLWEIATPLAAADVGGDGVVAFEIPGEFTLGLSLVAFVLDSSGMSYREGTAPHNVTYLTLEVPAADEPHVISPSAEEWAAAEKALGGR